MINVMAIGMSIGPRRDQFDRPARLEIEGRKSAETELRTANAGAWHLFRFFDAPTTPTAAAKPLANSAEGQHNPRSDAERLADVETHLARAVGPHLTSGSKTRLQRTDDGPRRLDLIGQNGSEEPDRQS